MKAPLFPYVMWAIFAVAVAGLEWWRDYTPHIFPKPWHMSGVAALVVVVLIIRWCSSCKQRD